MAYSTILKPTDYFNTKLYTGNGSTQTISGVGFQPDWTWIKNRNSATEHSIFDAVRGATYRLASNNGDAQSAQAAELTAFGSDGFTTGNAGGTNGSGNGIVSWNWKANGQGSANTDGSINTTYTSANTTAGFSISLFTGTGSNATVGHGLGVAPEWVIVKGVNNTGSWTSYHKSLGATKYMHLSETDAAATASSVWNSTAPTSSVFSVGAGVQSGSGNTYIAYCFAPIKGFSAMGSYTGNGNADGTFVYTGFKPAFVLVKETGTGNWIIKDNKRPIYNQNDTYLFANTSDAESSASTLGMDLLSNGFKLRGTAGDMNGSGTEIIYMAFAENPFVANVDGGLPTTAR